MIMIIHVWIDSRKLLVFVGVHCTHVRVPLNVYLRACVRYVCWGFYECSLTLFQKHTHCTRNTLLYNGPKQINKCLFIPICSNHSLPTVSLTVTALMKYEWEWSVKCKQDFNKWKKKLYIAGLKCTGVQKKQLFSENLTKKMACRIKTPKATIDAHIHTWDYTIIKTLWIQFAHIAWNATKSSSPDAKMRILIEIRVTFKFDFCNVYSVIMIITCE